ncbi:uncharacterized protein [Argopecten irradians]|uniref:uncharacterized protein n=1 Tax=Argopecten irradians TaxID=31199 RepID=UPI00371162BD
MENTTVRDSDSDSDTNTSESHPGPDGAFNTSMAQVAVCSSNETFECSAISIPSEDKERKNASPVSLENQSKKDSNSESDSNGGESNLSPEDTGTTAVVEIAVCSSGETLKESSFPETSEEKNEINGKKDYSMIQDKDGPPDDLSITAEVGGTSSKSLDDKDDPRM